MTGIVDVGGGMRGVFSAGIYDRFIEEGINFDLCIGVRREARISSLMPPDTMTGSSVFM